MSVSQPPPDISRSPPDDRVARKHYARFLVGSSSWFLAFGMQALVFQWLVVETLGESPTRVGLAQAAGLLPAIALLLVGGAAPRDQGAGWPRAQRQRNFR